MSIVATHIGYGKKVWILLSFSLLFFISSNAQGPINTSDTFAIAVDTLVVEDELEEEELDDYDEDDHEDSVAHFLHKPEKSELAKAYLLRTRNDSAIKKIKSEPEFYYADKSYVVKEKIRENSSGSGFGFTLYNFLTLLAVVVFAAILVLVIGNSHGGLFRSNKTISRYDEEQEMPTDIFAISYDKEIGKAEQKGDYRMAIRLRFLKLLKNLSQYQIINYQEKRTNLDYMMHLERTDWYDDFFRLTRHFEYSWYGQFEVSPDQYERIKNDFLQVDKKFGNPS